MTDQDAAVMEAVACPGCLAPPGAACRSRHDGAAAHYVHGERVDAYLLAKSQPPRQDLPDEAWEAARLIHPFVWGGKFERGRGPMVYAGGPYWRNALLEKADELEKAAKAARECARYLPHA